MLLTETGAAWATALTWMALARIAVAERAAPTVSIRFTYGFLPWGPTAVAVAGGTGHEGGVAVPYGMARSMTIHQVK
ncbi:hypothetical protein GCM10020229_74520 [Kitasatospora albolonga]